MGIFVVVIAFNGNSMPSSGWQVELTARVQHYAHVIREGAEVVPSWVTGAAIAAALAGLAVMALRQMPRSRRISVRRHATLQARASTQAHGHQEEPS